MLLQDILIDLRKGSLTEVNKHIQDLNTVAVELYNIKKLSSYQIKDLELLIRICNILYNRTDIDPLPIDDGLYDLLLEKYKTYDPNFQVGSEVITFANSPSVIEDKKIKINPIIEIDPVWQKRFFYEELKIRPDTSRQKVNPIIYTNTLTKGTHNTANNHPMLVGTLDKSKFVMECHAADAGVLNDSNVKVLERDFFGKHIQEGIITPNEKFEMILELKYDGISVEADCTDRVISARTRGDTGIGLAQDISDTLRDYVFPAAHIANLAETIGHPIGIKFEAIITFGALAQFNKMRETPYKNPRSAIVGLFGNNESPKFRELITLVPIEIDRSNIPSQQWDRQLEIEFLNKYYVTHGCPLRYAKISGDYRSCLFQIARFQEEAEAARSYLDFMFDGIVVSYLDEEKRARLGRKNHVNQYSMAVKFNPLKRQTQFVGYKYTVGQDGTITPMIYYNPVEFNGTIHNKSTGNSYARFKDLNLAIGDIVNVEYVNDVMPRVTACECEPNRENHKHNQPVEFIKNCPICGTPLVESENGKQMFCPNFECPGREQARLVNMLAKLNIKDFAEAMINSLNVHSLTDMLHLDYEFARRAIGDVNAAKFIERMNAIKTNPVPDYMIVGALGFTGVAQRTWQAILQRYTLKWLFEHPDKRSLFHTLTAIPGIGQATAETIINEFPMFERDIATILAECNIVDSKGKDKGIAVRCTGFRDKEFMAFLRSKGYDAPDEGSVTKETKILLVPFEGHESSKVAKAKQYGSEVIPVSLFKNKVGYQ